MYVLVGPNLEGLRRLAGRQAGSTTAGMGAKGEKRENEEDGGRGNE